MCIYFFLVYSRKIRWVGRKGFRHIQSRQGILFLENSNCTFSNIRLIFWVEKMTLTFPGIIYILLSHILEENRALLSSFCLLICLFQNTKETSFPESLSKYILPVFFKLITVISSFANWLKSIGYSGLLQHRGKVNSTKGEEEHLWQKKKKIHAGEEIIR